MQTHTYRSQIVQNKLSLAALLLFPILSGAQTYTATSRNASGPIPGPVTPVRATDFVSSIGVNVHCDVTTSPFRARFQEAKQLISGLGVKLVRAPGTDQFCVSSAQDLRRSSGIKTDFLMLPYEGSGVDDKFWMSAGGSYLANFLKNILGTDALASVEITNEVDVFYNLYRWHPNDLTTLVNSSTLPGSWGLYGPAIEAEAYSVMKSTPGLTQIPVYGPPLGYFAHGFAAGSMYGKVDFGTFHPYPYRVSRVE